MWLLWWRRKLAFGTWVILMVSVVSIRFLFWQNILSFDAKGTSMVSWQLALLSTSCGLSQGDTSKIKKLVRRFGSSLSKVHGLSLNVTIIDSTYDSNNKRFLFFFLFQDASRNPTSKQGEILNNKTVSNSSQQLAVVGKGIVSNSQGNWCPITVHSRSYKFFVKCYCNIRHHHHQNVFVLAIWGQLHGFAFLHCALSTKRQVPQKIFSFS